MRCLQPLRLKDLPQAVACGQCINCRMNNARQWAWRCSLELQENPIATFATFTYDDEHLPEHRSLDPRDPQLFFKRFRKSLGPHHQRIKYFLSGEYGGNTERPHYHAILFGYEPEKSDTYRIDSKYTGDTRLEESWQSGLVCVGDVTDQSIKYVAGYVLDKLTGRRAEEVYGIREPPFARYSKGIGVSGFLRNAEYYRDDGARINGHPISIPRSLQDKMPTVFDRAFREHLRPEDSPLPEGEFVRAMRADFRARQARERYQVELATGYRRSKI